MLGVKSQTSEATIYPHQFEIRPWSVESSSSGTITRSYHASVIGNGFSLQQSNGDWMEFSVETAAGTWTIRSMYATSSISGIIDLSVDGTEVDSYDAYSGSSVWNVTNDTTGLSLGAGQHLLRWTIDGQNASSGGYRHHFIFMSMIRTGD